jgi:phage gp29-like protein
MATTLKQEYGSVGRSNSALFQYNLATDEYLSTLTWPNDIKIYDKMERSDSQVKATLLLLELPLRSTNWFIQPKDKSGKAQQIADFIEETLFNNMFSFDELLKNICTMFAFGHSVFEKVFEVKNGFLQWKKFAIRPQSTIYDLIYDDVGDISSIQQYLINKCFTIVDIPIEKLLLFSHDIKQGDYRGRSVLRSAYKHWSIKEFLYKITNIGIERNFVGTPTVKLPPNANDDDITLAKSIVTSLRSNENGGVTIPEDFLLEMFEGKRTLMDVMPYIEYHDKLISRSILAQFINLDSKGGSYALGQGQMDLFLMLLNASGNYICNIINTHAVKQLVDYNFASDLYPELKFKPLGSEKIIDSIKLLTDGKIVIPDKDLETFVRELLKLPEKAKKSYTDQANKIENDNQNQNKGTKTEDDLNDSTEELQNENGKVEDPQSKDMKNKNPDETKKMSEDYSKYNDLNKKIDELENEFESGCKTIIQKQLKDLSTRVKNTDLSKLSEMQVKYKGELTNFVFNALIKAYKEGRTQILDELNLKADKNDIKDIDVIKAKAGIVANNISERVKTRFLSKFMNTYSDGMDIEKVSKQALKSVLGN